MCIFKQYDVIRKKDLPYRFLQILGIIVVGLVSYYYGRFRGFHTPELFFLLMAVAFLIGTFCLLFSCLISISTASILAKTVLVSISNLHYSCSYSFFFVGSCVSWNSFRIVFGCFFNTSN